MIVHAEIGEDGLLKISDPELRGKKVTLLFPEPDELERETDWEAVKAVFKKADAMDFPRRNPEDILKDLRELREP